MDKKRRDFIFKMSLIFIPSSLKLLTTGFIPKNSIDAQLNNKLGDSNQIVCGPGLFCFPKNPEIISTLYHIEIKSTDVITFTSDYHKINRHDQTLEIIGPGKYTAQYLGPDYGWNII